MRNKVLIAALAVVAASLVALHLRMPHGTQTWRLDQSAASARSGETMSVRTPRGAVDVNTATVEELDALSGVGPAIAQRIIEERETNGDFHYPEDLISVNGIGEKTLEKMREQLKLP